MAAKAVIVLAIAGLLAGCGSDDPETAQTSTPTAQPTSSARPASLVGRWELSRTCRGMVEGLDKAGLQALAPSIVGDYFPDQSPKQLARKADVCEGATPQQHSHFFTAEGQFGSLDQHEQQVDDASYRVVDDDTLRLSLEFGDETYRYSIVGDELTLEPVISSRAKREALANPFKFSLALHMAAVAYSGHTWKRVDCGDWCGGAASGMPSDSAAKGGASATATPAGATRLGAGELIAFERVVPGTEQRDLYAVGADGGEPRLLRSPGDYPHWSPDGRVLAFNACLNPPDCTTAVALLDRSTGDVHGHSMPDPELFTACAIWAPSGKQLACEGTSEVNPRRNGVYTIRASDGKGLTRLTRNPGGTDMPLAYSPDGTRVLLARTKAGGSGNEALFVTPVSGGRPSRITPWGYTDDYACWSPDGRTIVFGTNRALYRVGADGHGLAEITLEMPDGSSAQTAFDVCFSPGGERIVFSLGSPDPGLYTARADGGDVIKLTDSPADDHHANWGAAPGSLVGH